MSKTHLNEAELILLAQEGDKNAFGELVKLHQANVATITMNMLKDYHDAEEVGQQVFVKLYQKISSFRHESSLKTFVTRMAINFSLNEIKRKQRFWSRFSNDVSESSISINDESNDDKELIRKALQVLDPKFRAVLVLRSIEGYSSKETAEILSLPIGTVLSRQKRAMEKVKVILEQQFRYHGE